MIIITGGAGFIGGNLVRRLNQMGRTDILVVDNFTDGRKLVAASQYEVMDIVDKSQFYDNLDKYVSDNLEVIFHQGACSSTTEWDGRYLLENNYRTTRLLLNIAQRRQAQFIYASSASVYGLGECGFTEENNCESPINAYAASKLIFDNYYRNHKNSICSQVVGLRYFNVYGRGEELKGSMASVLHHFYAQLKTKGYMSLFKCEFNEMHGNQRRDFIYISDVIDVLLWFWNNPQHSGIFNCGTGLATSFNDFALQINMATLNLQSPIRYIDFPEHLKGRYQNYTCADVSKLRKIGYHENFKTISEGITHFFSE